ncbi:cupin domain-containing protein [Aphanothece hegewaldii CCALA 016]|uniref:Cupin domain-containing protein n=1 Tax=Aphanothece hegewaldii CCALA 016 TaxID=2107694 RepID=A0A2T1LUH0_9CHRO|nr:cupin domain-containing protein [Aphanothece hegewaldii]PSF35182.1 cupin domain-containing protein [Aphanothece hegewaldii CCALA 016]
MTTQPSPVAKTGENFTVADVGEFSQLHQYVFEHHKKGVAIEGKIFLKQLLSLTSAEVSLNTLSPKTSIPFYHKHKLNEEIYIFVRGVGEFQVDEQVFTVSEGTVVRVAPDGVRCIRNTSDVEGLNYIVIQSQVNSFLDSTIADGIGVPKQVSWEDKQKI